MRITTLLGIFGLSACSGTLDAGNDNPHPTAVDVVVRDGAVPQAGVRVIFQTADDALVEDTVTDADGIAAGELPDGGNVTVIRTFPLPTTPDVPPRPAEVYTYLGAQGGDHLVAAHEINEDAPPAAINVMVPDTAQGTVRVETPCGSGEGQAPIVPITVRGCAADLPVYVMDGDGSFFTHMPYSENVDVRGLAFKGSLSSSLSATNVQPGTAVAAEKRLETDGFVLYSSGAQRIEAAPANIDVPQLDGVDQIVVASISDAANHTQMVAYRNTYEGGPSVVDASANLIATVATPVFAPTGITWLEESPGAPDAVYASLAVTRGGPENPNNKYVRVLVAPYSGTSVRMPILPGTAVLYNPTPADDVQGALGLVKATGGYDAIRAQAFAVADLADATPAFGTLTLSYTGNAPGL